MYFDLSADGDGPTPVFSKTELDLTAFVATVTGFYRFVQEETGTADVLAGARLWATDTELSLKPGLGPGLSSDDQEVWVDPIIGLRGFMGVTDKVGLRAYGDVGGFGLASDITYQVFGSVNYTFTESITADVPRSLTGYIEKRRGYDYSKHGQSDNEFLDFITPDVVQDFCVLGTVDDHIAKVKALGHAGVTQFNIYLDSGDEENIISKYSEEIIPAVNAGA